jgi:methyl-accepting chemotaxis protein/methyl-accepting chemotaxis protein-1 (serine sensor receptor)
MSAPWTLGRKLTASGAALVFVMAAGAGIAYWGLASLAKDTGDVADRGAFLSRTRHAETLFNELFFGERSQIMAAYARDKALYDRWVTRNRDNYATLEKLLVQGRETAIEAAEREQVEKLIGTLGQWKATYPEVMKLVDSGQLQEAYVKSDKDGKPIRDASRAAFAALLKVVEADVASRVDGAAQTYSRAKLGLVAIGVFGAPLLFLVAWVVRASNAKLRTMAGQLRDGAEQVARAASQVSSSAQNLSNGATQQAAAIEESSASMEELASSTSTNAHQARQAATLMDEVQGQVNGANTSLGRMVTSMTAIRESSTKVQKIIKTIDEIAFQTNILALNAAVEAARAGEAGAGFAVVADEVRSLAQRAAQAARDTAGLIEAAARSAQEGQAHVEEVTHAVSTFTESVARVRGIAVNVSDQSLQQSQGLDQVRQAVRDMEKVTQSNAASAEESAAATEELNAQAASTLDLVDQLEQVVGVDAAGAAPPAASTRTLSFRRRHEDQEAA